MASRTPQRGQTRGPGRKCYRQQRRLRRGPASTPSHRGHIDHRLSLSTSRLLIIRKPLQVITRELATGHRVNRPELGETPAIVTVMSRIVGLPNPQLSVEGESQCQSGEISRDREWSSRVRRRNGAPSADRAPARQRCRAAPGWCRRRSCRRARSGTRPPSWPSRSANQRSRW